MILKFFKNDLEIFIRFHSAFFRSFLSEQRNQNKPRPGLTKWLIWYIALPTISVCSHCSWTFVVIQTLIDVEVFYGKRSYKRSE